jgi:hypothetical protein
MYLKTQNLGGLETQASSYDKAERWWNHMPYESQSNFIKRMYNTNHGLGYETTLR